MLNREGDYDRKIAELTDELRKAKDKLRSLQTK
jgi:hypothetical protein